MSAFILFCHWVSERIRLFFQITVSQATLQLRFDGPELQAHEMDVSLLGPSLIGFGEMCVEANRIITSYIF